MLKEQCNKIIDDLESEKRTREEFENEVSKRLEDTQQVFINQLTEENDEKNENFVLQSQNIDQKMGQVAKEITFEARNQDSNQMEAIRNINDHLSEIQGMIVSQRKNRYFHFILNREEAYEMLIKKLGNDILKLNEALSVTKRAREDTHSSLYKLIEELHGKIVKEINVNFFFLSKIIFFYFFFNFLKNERTSRVRNEETLIRFLDETVNKSNPNY